MLIVMYGVLLFMFCVAYQHIADDDGWENSIKCPNGNCMAVSMANVAELICDTTFGDCMLGPGDDQTCQDTFKDDYNISFHFLHDYVNGNDAVDKADKVLLAAVQREKWTSLEDVQRITAWGGMEQFIIIVIFFLIVIYPSWVNDYFARVCFNRVQREIELEHASRLEQEKTVQFLNKLVPASIVPQLCKGLVVAEKLDDVTIVFVDMVGFTKFSSQLDPDELVVFLNEMYSRFDVVLEKYARASEAAGRAKQRGERSSGASEAAERAKQRGERANNPSSLARQQAPSLARAKLRGERSCGASEAAGRAREKPFFIRVPTSSFSCARFARVHSPPLLKIPPNPPPQVLAVQDRDHRRRPVRGRRCPGGAVRQVPRVQGRVRRRRAPGGDQEPQGVHRYRHQDQGGNPLRQLRGGRGRHQGSEVPPVRGHVRQRREDREHGERRQGALQPVRR
jgi:hypothetical protein